MRKHEDFEELAALAAIGQLSVEEHGDLLEHLRDCAACRRSSDQFNFIVDELPLPEPSASDAMNGRTAIPLRLFGKAACARQHPSASALISFPNLYTVS